MSQEFLKVFQDAPLMWRRINSIGIILDCNTAYAQKLGYAKKEIVGKTIFEHVPTQTREAMNDSLKTWFETGEVKDKKLTFKKHDGTEFPVLLDATSIYDDEKNLRGSNTIIFDLADINEQKVTKIKEFFTKVKETLNQASTKYDDFDQNTKMEYNGIKEMAEKILAKDTKEFL